LSEYKEYQAPPPYPSTVSTTRVRKRVRMRLLGFFGVGGGGPVLAVPVPVGGIGVGAGPDRAVARGVDEGGGDGVAGAVAGLAGFVGDKVCDETFSGASCLAAPGMRVSLGFLSSARHLWNR
jgi:hypothetical protein